MPYVYVAWASPLGDGAVKVSRLHIAESFGSPNTYCEKFIPTPKNAHVVWERQAQRLQSVRCEHCETIRRTLAARRVGR